MVDLTISHISAAVESDLYMFFMMYTFSSLWLQYPRYSHTPGTTFDTNSEFLDLHPTIFVSPPRRAASKWTSYDHLRIPSPRPSKAAAVQRACELYHVHVVLAHATTTLNPLNAHDIKFRTKLDDDLTAPEVVVVLVERLLA